MRGVVTITLWTANLFFWGALFLLTIALRLVPGSRAAVTGMLQRILEMWAHGHARITDVMVAVEWDVRGLETLSPEENYLIISNHQSWIDIPIILRFLIGRASFVRFFAKRELIWMPIVGAALWALEMPMVRRHPRELVEQRPELREQDLETTRRACQYFGRRRPESLLSFVEGTRFTQEKHAAQESPYRHLLKPKLGGISLVLAALGDRLRAVIDITIVYTAGAGPIFWRFANGEIGRVRILLSERSIPTRFRGHRLVDEELLRHEFFEWMQQIWAEKDQRIGEVLSDLRSSTGGEVSPAIPRRRMS